ncbi:hypothetical protein D3C75_844660 [compost metagenome]
MEHLAVILAQIVYRDRALLLLENSLKVVDVRFGRHFCGECRNITFQQLTRLEHFKRANIAAEKGFFFRFIFCRNAHDIHTGTLANIHCALQFEHQQCFTNNRAADAIGFSNITFRRQT